MSYFCVIDSKKECFSVYMDGKFYDKMPSNAMYAWSYNDRLNKNIQLANIYCGNNSLNDACPLFLKKEWESISNKIDAFINSFKQARVKLNDACLRDLIPESILKEFCEIKIRIIKYIFKNYKKPPNYNFLFNISKMVWEISQQKLNLDIKPIFLKRQEKKAQELLKKVDFSNAYINYNMFGTVTGRLTTTKKSFPILNLKKEYRSCLKPVNDYFLELDYNSAELRVALALLGKKQPLKDLHEWNIENIFKEEITRQQAKVKAFRYLYNPSVCWEQMEMIYKRDEIINKYWDGQKIKNYFNRTILANSGHYAINYIIQSTANDLMLQQVFKIFNMLKDKKTFIAFTMHDSVILDVDKGEKECYSLILEIFKNTPFGVFKTNSSIGQNFGNMNVY